MKGKVVFPVIWNGNTYHVNGGDPIEKPELCGLLRLRSVLERIPVFVDAAVCITGDLTRNVRINVPS